MMGPSGPTSDYGWGFLFSPVVAAGVQAGGQVATAAVTGRSGVRMAEIGAGAQEVTGRQQIQSQAVAEQATQQLVDRVLNIALLGAFAVVGIVLIKTISE